MIPYERRAWLRLLLSGRGSLARGVLPRVVGFGVIALAVLAIDHYLAIPIRLPVGFHEVAGVVIGLILAFRTNTAYARFWEGRTLWGGIVNAARNLARTADVHGGLANAEQREFNAWIVAFAHATRCRLRGISNIAEARDILSEEDYRRLLESPHPPLFCAEQLSRRIANLVRRNALDPLMAAAAERHLATLVDCLGGCERIYRTPTPLGYVLLLERGNFLYLSTLPAGLLSRLDWYMPLVTLGVSYLVIMIESLGNELDNPFGMDVSDLPLDGICATISYDLLGEGTPPPFPIERGVGGVEI